MKAETWFNVFGILVLGMLLIFLASGGGLNVLTTGPESLARGTTGFFQGFKGAVG